MELEMKLPSLKEASGDENAPESATVSFWYIDEGETIEQGEDLIAMVTDKAEFNVPAEKSGTLKKKLVDEDAVVEVGQPVAILETEE